MCSSKGKAMGGNVNSKIGGNCVGTVCVCVCVCVCARVCVCVWNGNYVGTKTWLREKRRTWGKVCLCCVLKCVVQYFGNDATFLAPQQTLTDSSHMKLM